MAKFPVLTCLIAGASLSLPTAHAAWVNLDVADNVSSYSGTGAAPDAGTFWNVAGTINSTYSNLTASDGITPTDIDVAFSGFGGEFPWSGSLLVNDRFYGPASGTAFVTISGLTPSIPYDLYVYASFWDTTYSVPGLLSEFAAPDDSTGFNLPWIEGNQYVLFESAVANLSGEIPITITATGSGAGQWTNIAGLQISTSLVPPIPEPSRALLSALALFCLAAHRRRRR